MEDKSKQGELIPLWGRDEMNLVELPFGPITATSTKTLNVEHSVFDPVLKRMVMRKTLVTGSDAFGLPRPIDDQVLVGLKALTQEAGFESRKVHFSSYHLCRIIGWKPDGRSYQRLDESLSRIAGTTLKFKDAWWDKGEKEWKSKTFHLLEDVELCSRVQLDRKRMETGTTSQKLCYFVWNEVIWKSFQDGFVKKLDMDLFRRISTGRRREVPTRLFRILDKKLYKRRSVAFDVRHLGQGILGLAPNYSPSQMLRIILRASEVLKEEGFIGDVRVIESKPEIKVEFLKASKKSALARKKRPESSAAVETYDHTAAWIGKQDPNHLATWEADALRSCFGSELERNLIKNERMKVAPVKRGGALRRNYLHRYWREAIVQEALIGNDS